MYQTITAMLTQVLWLALALTGFSAILKDRQLIQRLGDPRGVTCLAGAGLGAVIGVLCLLLGRLLGEEQNPQLLLMLLLSIVVLGGMAFCILPLAIELEGDEPALDLPMVGGWTALALGWSLLWLMVVTAFVPFRVQESYALKDVNIGRPAEFLFVTAFALIAAIAEEVLYRGGLQRLVLRANGKPAVAIAVSTIAWTLAHSGFTEPHGLKELQMVGLGVILGVVCHRHGLRAAIAVHAANNLMAMGLGAVL